MSTLSKLSHVTLLIIIILQISCSPKLTEQAIDPKIKKASKPMTKMEALIQQMTLEEKIGQMNQYNGFFDVTGPAPQEGDNQQKYEQIKAGGVGSMLNVRGAKEVRAMQELAVDHSRLGIPMIFGFDVIHGLKTTFPIPLAEAASWDMDYIEKAAAVAAKEASAAGLNWTFAPMVDISRDARWGRVMEGAGEDPYLGSQVAVARVKGFQGDDLSADHTVLACTKHFAAYGFAESGKDYNTADIGLSTLYNIVLPPFKATIDAGVGSFMNSFNELNGIPATADQFLQKDILIDEWGFDNLMVSDWGSIREMVAHGYAEDGKHAAELAANAGCHMDMESSLYTKHLKGLVEDGKVSIETIDDAVRRVLEAKEKLGLFEDPYRYCNEAREKASTYTEENIDIAHEVAKRSIVLLKNDKNLLPLPMSGKKIAVIGQLADSKNSPLGNWRLASDDNSASSVLEALQSREGNEINYTEGVSLYSGQEFFVFHITINEDDPAGIEEAVALAKSSDIVVMVLGEHGMQTGEGRSRANLDLPGLQQELLEQVHAANPNVALVLMNGRPLAIEWADDNIPAIVEAWHLGTKSGDAIADVLYGDYNPSGKLPMTFPRHVGQVPIYYNHKSTGRPGPSDAVFWSHYTDESNDPLYAFGHGLSYASFEYTDLQLEVDSTSNNIDISVNVKNTSGMAGEEVIQLYIRDHFASITRPVKELKRFQKTMIAAGELKSFKFSLSQDDLSYYNNKGKLVFEPGAFTIFIGGSSDTVLQEDVIVK